MRTSSCSTEKVLPDERRRAASQRARSAAPASRRRSTNGRAACSADHSSARSWASSEVRARMKVWRTPIQFMYAS